MESLRLWSSGLRLNRLLVDINLHRNILSLSSGQIKIIHILSPEKITINSFFITESVEKET
jgi:hypothetical protein